MPVSITIHIDTIEQVTITGTPGPTIRWHVGPMQPLTGGSMPIEVTMTTEMQVRLAITPSTPGGDPAPIDGPAQWTIQGPCTLVPIDDLSTWVRGGPGSQGDSTVTVQCDADMGQGFVPIGDTSLIHVSMPMAASVGLKADEPVLIPGA
jgi:hypothetical protein